MPGRFIREIAPAVFLIAATWSSLSSAQPAPPVVPAVSPPPSPAEEGPVRNGARMKRYDQGRRIVDRFDATAGDRDVVVERWENDGEGEGPPPGISDVAWRTIFSPVVMVVRVHSVEGQVTEDGTWIESRVTSTVIQLLKNSTPANLQTNSPVSFVTSGGALKVGNNLLEARTRTQRYRTKPFRADGVYLVFALRRPGDILYAHPEIAYEIVGNRLRALRETRGGLARRIGDAGADAVIAEAMASRGLQAPPR